MLENEERIGSLTNSQIHKIMKIGKVDMSEKELQQNKIENPKSKVKTKAGGFSAAGKTYIEERVTERRMGRSLEVKAYAKAMAWGQIMERYVHAKLGMEYIYICKGTLRHPSIEGWSGSTDFAVLNERAEIDCIAEMKAYEPKNFAKYTDAILSKDINIIKEKCPEEYWQIVGNAIINSVDYGEAICFMPYRSELESIRELARSADEKEQWKYRFISERDDMSLAHLPDGGYYKDLNKFKFEIPAEDKIFMTARACEALKLINENIILEIK